jgi:hypothetical protein
MATVKLDQPNIPTATAPANRTALIITPMLATVLTLTLMTAV